MESKAILYQEFLNSPIHQGSTERFLQLAIESCINIGNPLIALYQFTKSVSTPATYADIFTELGRLGVVEHEFMQRLIKMAGFRNRLVHLYWEIDYETLYGYLQNNLNDFKWFQKCVVEFLNKNEIP